MSAALAIAWPRYANRRELTRWPRHRPPAAGVDGPVRRGCDVSARVRVVDPAALRAAALRMLDAAFTIDGATAGEPDDALVAPVEDIATSDAAALQRCVEPTDGMWPLLEAGAARIDHVEIAVDDLGADGLRARWSVTVRLQDVGALRDLATRHPSDAGNDAEVTQSLAVAWARAADPYAPLRDVPGVMWTPAAVSVERVCARVRG
jgi:hypothetical protein